MAETLGTDDVAVERTPNPLPDQPQPKKKRRKRKSKLKVERETRLAKSMRVQARDRRIYDQVRVEGRSQRDVAAEHKISQPRVHQICERVHEWMGLPMPPGLIEGQRLERLLAATRTHQLRLAWFYEQASLGWRKSLEAKITVKKRWVKGEEVEERTAKTLAGNYRYLDQLLKIDRDLIEFEGLSPQGEVDLQATNRLPSYQLEREPRPKLKQIRALQKDVEHALKVAEAEAAEAERVEAVRKGRCPKCAARAYEPRLFTEPLPLTPALSPEYRGEGVEAVETAAFCASPSPLVDLPPPPPKIPSAPRTLKAIPPEEETTLSFEEQKALAKYGDTDEERHFTRWVPDGRGNFRETLYDWRGARIITTRRVNGRLLPAVWLVLVAVTLAWAIGRSRLPDGLLWCGGSLPAETLSSPIEVQPGRQDLPGTTVVGGSPVQGSGLFGVRRFWMMARANTPKSPDPGVRAALGELERDFPRWLACAKPYQRLINGVPPPIT